MLSNAEIEAIWNNFPEDGRDGMTLEQFKQRVRNVLDPKKNTKILDEMVEIRRKHTAGLMAKKRIDKAMERKKVMID